jgi:hypothetical protein
MSQNKLFLAIDNTKPAAAGVDYSFDPKRDLKPVHKMLCPDCYGTAVEIYDNGRARCLGFKCGHETDLKALFRKGKA